MENKIPMRFFAVTFLWSWLLWGIPLLFYKIGIIPQGDAFFSAIILPLNIIAAFGPAIGTFVSLRTLEGKGAIKKHLKSYLSIKFGLKVWLAMFLVLGGTSFIAWILPEFFGETRVAPFMPFYYFPLYLLLMIFLGGGQEEIGWRGYISPYLEKKFGLIFGALILGIVWAVWHLPIWFIPVSSHGSINFFGFMLMTIGFSYFFSWVINKSGKRLFSGLVVHGIANAFAPFLPYIFIGDDSKQTRFWIYCILIFVIGLVIVAARTIKNKKTIYNKQEQKCLNEC